MLCRAGSHFRVFEERLPRGSEFSFASEADVAAKFEKLAKHTLPDAQMAELRDAILNMEDLTDAGDIPRLLSKG